MIAEPIPEWLEVYMNRVNSIKGVFGEGTKANHVLVNEYLPGNGILPHLDGPLFYPVISTISLGSAISLDFYNPIDNTKSCDSIQFHDRYQFSIYVQPRSLLVLSDQLYDKVCSIRKNYDFSLKCPMIFLNVYAISQQSKSYIVHFGYI